MEFEFDEAKSENNEVKHGIDFQAAQALWNDIDRIEIPARTDDEPRFLVIGRIGGRIWSAVVTPREQLTRIISVSILGSRLNIQQFCAKLTFC